MQTSRALGILCLALGLLLYIGAVAGVLFGGATPPGDVGALSTLVAFLLFGGLAFVLGGEPRLASPARPIT